MSERARRRGTCRRGAGRALEWIGMTGSTEAHHYVCWFEVTGRIATYEFWMPQATYAAEEPVLIAMGEAAEYPPSPPVDAGGS